MTLCYEVFGRPLIPEDGKIQWVERYFGSDVINNELVKLVDKPTDDMMLTEKTF